MTLREDQILRYARHILLPEVGGVGQERLLGSSVLVGGGLGLEAAAIYLAAAGVGRLGLTDASPSLHARLAAINPDCVTGPATDPRSPQVALALGESEPAARASDAAVAAGCLLIRATVNEDGFAIEWLQAGRDGCARCRAPQGMIDPAPSTPTDPALDALIGSLMATEALLALLGRANRAGHRAQGRPDGTLGPLAPVPPSGPCPICGGGAP